MKAKNKNITFAVLVVSTIISFAVGWWSLGSLLVISLILFLIVLVGLELEKSKRKEAEKKLIAMQVNRNLEIIGESEKIINKSKNFKTILHRFEVIIENIERLKTLQEEHPNLEISDPKPPEIEARVLKEKENFIKIFTIEEADKIMAKVDDLMGIKSKISTANKALLKVIDGKKELKEKETIDEVNKKETEIKLYIQKIELEDLLEKAKKALFMGQKAKALSGYKEALYYIQNDEIDDSLQKEKIDEINNKITELSN